MSDLTQLLASMAAVAVKDYGATIAPALATAAATMATHPSMIPSAGTAFLATLANAGVPIAADEITAVVGWINSEIGKLAAKIPTK